MRCLSLLPLLLAIGCDPGGGATSVAEADAGPNGDAGPLPAELGELWCRPVSDGRPAAFFGEPIGMELESYRDNRSVPDGLQIRWRLDEQPAESATVFADPGTPAFEFEPDVPGVYRFCYLASLGIEQETGCCRVSAVQEFVAREHPEALRVTREWLLLQGRLRFRWVMNQPVAADPAGAQVDAPAEWGVARVELTGWSSGREPIDVRPAYTVHFPRFEPRPGDRVEVRLPVIPRITPTPGASLQSSLAIVERADLDFRGPEVVEAELRPTAEAWTLRVRIEGPIENDYLNGSLRQVGAPASIRLARDGDGPWWVAEFDDYDPPDGPVYFSALDVTPAVPFLEEFVQVMADPRFWSAPVEVRVIQP